MSDIIEVTVPDLGDFADVEVIEVLVAPGDTVAVEDPLLTLETDKAAMDVPSPAAGTLKEVRVATGDRVNHGDVIALLVAESDAPAADATPKAAPDEGPPAAAQVRDVEVPDIGDFDEVEVIEVHVSDGQTIAANDPLITLESDKAAMDVPASFAGTVESVRVAVGDKVSKGTVIASLKTTAAGTAAAPEHETPPAAGPAPPRPQPPPVGRSGGLPPIDEAGFARAHASPSVRRFARELGVDLGRVRGTGLKSRITADDVKVFVKSVMSGDTGGRAALPAVPEVDFAKFGEVERRKLTRIQKIAGPRLQASWLNVPHVTQHDEADITDMEAARRKLKAGYAADGVKITPLAFLVRAAARALAEFPTFNASLSPAGDELILKHYCHIGFAADTPQGLVVPVIRDADKKSLRDIARELGELSATARDGKLSPKEMSGGCFTISSLGGIGGTSFTPIVNAPEVAILGVSRSLMRPVWQDGEFVPRLMLPLSLSYDHRVIDGAAAARFTTRLGTILADVAALVD